jgi:hypothetical protein
VREVATRLFRGWIEETESTATEEPVPAERRSPPSWFGAARTYAQRVSRHDMTSVRRSIARGRAREDRPGGAGKDGR